MGDVFLLGAGFSKAISSSMPLLGELSSEIRKHIELPSPLLSLGDNVELWMTYLSQPHPWLTEAENLRNKALFLKINQTIGVVLGSYTQEVSDEECPAWLEKLVTWWHKSKSHIITLNYDTLIERAAGLVNLGARSRLTCHNLYPVTLTETRMRNAAIFSGTIESFKLCKLHGSVNWYYSGASSYIGELLYCSYVAPWGGRADSETEGESIAAASDKVSLIVPPTTEKAIYFQHETIRRVWFLAGEALKNASRLICIGYSFPQTDLSIRFFLNNNQPLEKVPLVIVNPDQNAGARYKELVGNSYDVQHTFTGPDAVQEFVKNLQTA